MTEPFVSINELSKQLGIPAHTLRYWEKVFAGTIRPVTGAGGRRYYRAEDVAKIKSIRGLLYGQGYTIAGVRKLIAGGQLRGEEPSPAPKADNAPKAKSVAAVADAIQVAAALELLDRAGKALS